MAKFFVLLALAAAVALSTATMDEVVGLQRLDISSIHADVWSSAGKTLVLKDDSEWNAMDTAAFSNYAAVALMDRSCVGADGTTDFLAVNALAWGSAINGNLIIIGTDEAFHNGQGGNVASKAFAAFAVGKAGKVGGYISLSCYYHGVADFTPVPFLNAAFPSMSSGFTVRGVGCYNDVEIVASSDALTGVSESNLGGWSCSVHEAFDGWPEELEVLVIAEGIGSSYETPGGILGTPYILASGVRAISSIALDPETQNHEPGEVAELTATVTTSGIEGVDTMTLAFVALSGPNAGTIKTVSMADYSSGVVTITYVGAENGNDVVVAELIDATGRRIQRSNRVVVVWKGIIESGVCGRLGKRNVIVRGTVSSIVGKTCECRLDHCFQCRFFFRTKDLVMSPTPVCQRCEREAVRLGTECLAECPPGFEVLIKHRPNITRDMRRGRECVRLVPATTTAAPGVVGGGDETQAPRKP